MKTTVVRASRLALAADDEYVTPAGCTPKGRRASEYPRAQGADRSIDTARLDLSEVLTTLGIVRGGAAVRALWYVVSLVIFESGWFPLGGAKRWLLRLFGARSAAAW